MSALWLLPSRTAAAAHWSNCGHSPLLLGIAQKSRIILNGDSSRHPSILAEKSRVIIGGNSFKNCVTVNGTLVHLRSRPMHVRHETSARNPFMLDDLSAGNPSFQLQSRFPETSYCMRWRFLEKNPVRTAGDLPEIPNLELRSFQKEDLLVSGPGLKSPRRKEVDAKLRSPARTDPVAT